MQCSYDVQLPEYEHGSGRKLWEDGPTVSESGEDSIYITVHDEQTH